MNKQNKKKEMTPGEWEEYQYLKNMLNIEEIFEMNKKHDKQDEKEK
ncbi:MAG: hypothetical protein MRERV_48c007 [Mycoplasmataceae bacterium RV_VA103A]|nr:MAG: hypothetical protein MRERV_48c007 [Mycoplasmataceae bacterium RV_VA103A]